MKSSKSKVQNPNKLFKIMRSMLNKQTMLIFFIISVTFFSYSRVHAAEFYFGARGTEVPIRQFFEVGVFLNTNDKTINAFEGEITFPSDMVTLGEVRDGNSMVSLWVEKPHLTSPGVVSFSGITPGGFSGPQGYLFSLIFESTDFGTFTIESRNENVYLNDGEGTKTEVTRSPITLTATLTSSTEAIFLSVRDTEPPESFSVTLVTDSHVFDGKHTIVFTTQDKGGGVSGYQVAEYHRPFWKFSTDVSKLSWVTAQSPYLLHDQKLRSVVYVKALDYSGNERVSVLYPQGIQWYEKYAIWCILGLLILLVSSIVIRLYGGKKKKY
ncbi:MAG TPA: cohesin domain-containing protein [Candidatus Magasanikbacteria bacterium]|nr:cohesin domain-containing protein [Candidatus Magasanikbacteria bacterium]